MTDVQGVVVNDAHGLLIKADGDLMPIAVNGNTGYFSTIADTAATLSEEQGEEQPTIRLETSTRTLLISDFTSEQKGKRTIVLSQSNSSKI